MIITFKYVTHQKTATIRMATATTATAMARIMTLSQCSPQNTILGRISNQKLISDLIHSGIFNTDYTPQVIRFKAPISIGQWTPTSTMQMTCELGWFWKTLCQPFLVFNRAGKISSRSREGNTSHCQMLGKVESGLPAKI